LSIQRTDKEPENIRQTQYMFNMENLKYIVFDECLLVRYIYST